MNQKKIGEFLKELRKEKELTQEQLAEKFYVSNRTVSRWETGSNLPDISTLVELADFYNCDIREIINGERKSENMNEEEKKTLKAVAEYAEEDKATLLKRVRTTSITGITKRLIPLEYQPFNFWGLPPCRHMTYKTRTKQVGTCPNVSCSLLPLHLKQDTR